MADKRKADEIDDGAGPASSKVKGEPAAEEEEGEGEEEGEEKVVGVQTDDGIAFSLGNKKLLRVRTWKKMVLVDIREFYEDKNEELKPGKKGISLTLDQWGELTKAMSGIQDAIAQQEAE
uniref:Transcriptional coactivator p15 (PC4) C-terminal domain-containing protein n=1 Tax=Florenciella parvula TaxID=236787 RepID=A0A7S2BFY1_9STRA